MLVDQSTYHSASSDTTVLSIGLLVGTLEGLYVVGTNVGSSVGGVEVSPPPPPDVRLCIAADAHWVYGM